MQRVPLAVRQSYLNVQGKDKRKYKCYKEQKAEEEETVKLILILFDVSEKDLESCLSSSIDNIIGLCLAPLLDK